jgi:WD40 repeat protein
MLTGHKQGVASVAFSFDGKTVCTSSPDGTIRLWHLETGRETLSFAPEGVGANRLRFSRDNQLLIIFGHHKTWALRVPSLEAIDQHFFENPVVERSS